jgi:hypothetical protein
MTDNTASPDAIPFGKLALRGADSAAPLKEPPEPRTLKCQSPPMRAGHEHPAEAGETRNLAVASFLHLRPVSQEPIFLPRGCLCPRLILTALATPRNTRAMPIKPSRISTGNTVYPAGNRAERGAMRAQNTSAAPRSSHPVTSLIFPTNWRLRRRHGPQIAARGGCDPATVKGTLRDAIAAARRPLSTASPDASPSCKLIEIRAVVRGRRAA